MGALSVWPFSCDTAPRPFFSTMAFAARKTALSILFHRYTGKWRPVAHRSYALGQQAFSREADM